MQIPTKAGQICRITNPMEDENPDEVYIMKENPEPFAPEDTVYVVGLKDLQRKLCSL